MGGARVCVRRLHGLRSAADLVPEVPVVEVRAGAPAGGGRRHRGRERAQGDCIGPEGSGGEGGGSGRWFGENHFPLTKMTLCSHVRQICPICVCMCVFVSLSSIICSLACSLACLSGPKAILFPW